MKTAEQLRMWFFKAEIWQQKPSWATKVAQTLGKTKIRRMQNDKENNICLFNYGYNFGAM